MMPSSLSTSLLSFQRRSRACPVKKFLVSSSGKCTARRSNCWKTVTRKLHETVRWPRRDNVRMQLGRRMCRRRRGRRQSSELFMVVYFNPGKLYDARARSSRLVTSVPVRAVMNV